MSVVWRECPWDEVAAQRDVSIARFVGSSTDRGDSIALQSSSGAIALVVAWEALVSSLKIEARFEPGDAAPHRVAFVEIGDRGEASGLLRFSDAVGILRQVEDETVETPPGLVPCGQIVVDETADSQAVIALFKGKPIEHRSLLQGAPIDRHEPEDLDAREAWFEKRHGRNG